MLCGVWFAIAGFHLQAPRVPGDALPATFTYSGKATVNLSLYIRYLTLITFFLRIPQISGTGGHRYLCGREFSARYRTDYSQDTMRKNLGRNSAQIRAVNGESLSRTYLREVACKAKPALLQPQRYTVCDFILLMCHSVFVPFL